MIMSTEIKVCKCIECNPYHPVGICAPMQPIGWCINCGLPETVDQYNIYRSSVERAFKERGED